MTTTRELLQMALKALEDCDKSDRAWFSDVVLLNKIRAHLAKPEPAWMTDIVGYGQFVGGKLVACSQSEMHIAIGGENVECRPLYSVKESK